MPIEGQPLIVEGLSTFDLTVASGECVALTGPSGSGKSRLLRLIADLDPGSGTARIGDLVRDSVPANQWRRMVIYLPADSGWWTSLVAAHMADEQAAQRLLPKLGLSAKLMQAAPDEISSGERQRLALIRALILQPRFLLLDEATSALDPASTLKVESLLEEEKRGGMGLLVVSHDPEQVARTADRHYALSDKGLVEVSL